MKMEIKMKDFAKSIVCNSKAEVENYDYDDWKDNERHKWTVRDIEHKIDTIRSRLEMNKRRITELRQMVNSGNYGSLTKEDLRKEEADYEANQMKIKQLLSMKSRATGNALSMPKTKYDDEIHRLEVEYMKQTDVSTPEKAIKEMDRKDKINKRIQELKELQRKEWDKVGNSKVGNAEPDITRSLSEYDSLIRQAKDSSSIKDIIDDLQYDIKEYEIAINEMQTLIRKYQGAMSDYKIMQSKARDAARNFK